MRPPVVFKIQYRLKKSTLRQPASIAQFDRSWKSSSKHTASWLSLKPISALFVPKCNLRLILGAHRSLLDHQNSENKLVTASFMWPLCWKHPIHWRPNWSSIVTTVSLLLLLLLLTVVVVFHIVVESNDCSMVIQFTLLKHWPHMVVRSHNHIVISLDLFKDWPEDNIIPYSEILNSFVLWKAETIKCIWSLFCWICGRNWLSLYWLCMMDPLVMICYDPTWSSSLTTTWSPSY